MKIAVIPARGGSKRIPRKNIKSFASKPMMAWSIEAARACGLFERIIVSTDDDEIAAVAESWGAEAPFRRPARLADDFAGTTEVVGHAVAWLSAQGTPAEYVCCIYATAPFLQAETLSEGYRKLKTSGAAYVFSATSFPSPIQRAFRINADGSAEMLFPQHFNSRSQDLEACYHDAGQFYWGRAQAFADNVMIFSPAAQPLVLPRHLVQDIDTPDDWRRAELMFEAWQQLERRARGELA